MQELKAESRLQKGKYRIVRKLGQGGFGITYEGEQTNLGRRVAIKEFFMKDYCNRDEDTSHVTVGSEGSRDMVAEYRRKFLKEAQLIASMEDVPHVIRIHDIFEENETAYYVMSFVDGGSLKDLVKREGRLSEQQAVDYIGQVGEALTKLHERNILHLDIKPDNVLLTPQGEAVLIDFGVSKHYDEKGSQTSSTPLGLSKGYAPTEQYQQGGMSQFSPATDVYSLAATLYYLLTAQTPPEANIIFEEGFPERPSFVSVPLWDAIEKAMQPRRKDRTQSVPQFLDALALDGEATVVATYQKTDEEGTPTVLGKPEVADAAVVQQGAQQVVQEEEEEEEEEEPAGNRWLKPLLIAIAVFAVLVLLYFLLIKKSEPKTDAYWDDDDEYALPAEDDEPSVADDDYVLDSVAAADEYIVADTAVAADQYDDYYAEQPARDESANRQIRQEAQREEQRAARQEEVIRERPIVEDRGVEEHVFEIVEQMPSFPGGDAALMSFLSQNVHYPAVAEENGIQGRVVATFIVERDGSISDVRVVKSVDPSLDKEAVRVLKSMPKWTPGRQNGSPVRTKYTVPVTFRLN